MARAARGGGYMEVIWEGSKVGKMVACVVEGEVEGMKEVFLEEGGTVG